ncbi:MAG: S9 family peptidase [Pseudomonadota bacterium]
MALSKLQARFTRSSATAFSAVGVAVCIAMLASGLTFAKPLSIDDLMEIQSVRDPQLSPDGNWLAYTVRRIDEEKDKRITQIWMVEADGGQPIPMTAADSSASQPRFSPDGRFLSFTASRGDDGATQVYTLNRLGGEAEQLTSIKQGISSYEWSPDGARLLLLIKDPTEAQLTEDSEDDDKPRPHVIDRIQFKRDYTGYLDRRREHLYVFTPGDEAPVQLTSGDYDADDPVWSPDGKHIAFVSDRSEEPDSYYGENVWTVSVDDEAHALTKISEDEGTARSPVWSPDGKHISYVRSVGLDVGGSALSPTRRLEIANSDGTEQQVLTPELDRNVSNPSFSDDGSRVFFQLQDEGKVHLASIKTDGEGFRRDLQGEISVDDYALRSGVRTVLAGGLQSPPELYRLNDGLLSSLTDVNAKVLDEVAQPKGEKLTFTSADGTPIDAFYLYPISYEEGQRYPTILWLHGGPASQFDFGFHTTAQLFAANGYAVILPNPRGSVGYGEAFAKATVAAWGVKDVEDVLAAVDHGIEIGLVDEDRLGVGGWSYGGILTNYVITQSNRFKAASSGASLGLVAANYGHDHYQLMYELEFGLPWQNRERWDELSPFWKVENIKTPTLWMGGALDWNVPIINSEQMYLAMKRLGQDTQLVVYPDEHHGISRPSFVRDRYERWLEWFDRYLK